MVIIWLMVVNNLVGGWPTPLKNMSSSMGRMTSHIVWTIKNLPNHQPVITVQNKWYPLPLRWWREIGIDADRTLPNHFVFQMADVQNVLVLKRNRENWIQPPAEYLGKAWMFGFWKGFYPKRNNLRAGNVVIGKSSTWVCRKIWYLQICSQTLDQIYTLAKPHSWEFQFHQGMSKKNKLEKMVSTKTPGFWDLFPMN